MSVEMRGGPELQARLVAIERTSRQMMGRLGLAAVREQKRLVPVKTGNLRRTIHLGTVTPRSATTETSAVYARAIEFGGREYDIKPRKAKALFFASQKVTTDRFGGGAKLSFTKGGRLSAASMRKYGNAAFVVAKVVHHPKTKAQPFMLPGAKRAIADSGLKNIIIRAWNEAA